jgi:hypothetical protein
MIAFASLLFADAPAIGLALAPPASDTAAAKPAAPASR